jgi:hypothetical protein
MGNLGLTTPRVVLSSDVQLYFKRAHVSKDVAALVTGWFEDGAPLGLTPDVFEVVMRLQGRAEPIFKTFDTDRNQKVDAFEVLSAAVILASGSIDEKIETLFPMFDFAGIGQLNFDETNIAMHSVYRGLKKVCCTSPVADRDIMLLCQQLFDAHNLPYDKNVTKEQVRRWLRNDVEAAGFFDVFHNGLAWPDVQASLTKQQCSQESIYSQLCGSSSAADASSDSLLQCVVLRQSLESPPDEVFRSFVDAMAKNSADGLVSADIFTKAVRAWNVFSICDAAGEQALDAKELAVLLQIFLSRQPAGNVVDQVRKRIALSCDSGGDGRIRRIPWIIGACGEDLPISSQIKKVLPEMQL